MALHPEPGNVGGGLPYLRPTVTKRPAAELGQRGVHFADTPGRSRKDAWADTLDCMADRHRKGLLNRFLMLDHAAIHTGALALADKVGILTITFDSVIRGDRMD
ncbi:MULTISPECIES: hypothetical protein [Tabrizicola]|uniref:hypothetical protein n=1 Tax=Tabrizicola TaxID=1443919 RepID=UPI0010802735|nr:MULTISPECIES: hypothetical protein [Paracoccaceae]